MALSYSERFWIGNYSKIVPRNSTCRRICLTTTGKISAPLNPSLMLTWLSRNSDTIASHSLGLVSAGHDLKSKLQAAASHNILGIELFYEDLQALASLFPDGPTPSNLLTAANDIRNLTNSLSLTTIVLQPFLQYEGLLSRNAHTAEIDKAKLWLQLAKILGTDLILVSSNSLPESECTSDLSTIMRDMTELADLGAKESPPVRFAYEDLAWGTHINTWEGVHAVVSAVDRWNFGYCFDTSNIAGLVFGDPESADGKTGNAEVALADSLKQMVKCVNRKKLFLIQVVDAERVSTPITPEHPWRDGEKQLGVGTRGSFRLRRKGAAI